MTPFVTGKHDTMLSGRGFDQESFHEKDESHVTSYSTRNDSNELRPDAFDVDHPHMYHNRASPGAILLG